MPKATKEKPKKIVDTLLHKEASRRNIPTAEYQSVMRAEELSPIRVAYERRNRDLDPQLVWRGKDEQDWSDLVVPAPPLYIQEKVHPKVLIDELERQTKAGKAATEPQFDLFANFNGLPSEAARTEFYQHDGHWSNRMILGDSLQVMASLAEREGLRSKVQCIYIDPPYGIKFNSNFQWSTTSRDVKDGNTDHITREPEQVKAFRDTWRDGIHSYLTYLRDRISVARDLLADSGSIFVQIGAENVHRVRAVLDEIFGDSNFIAQITYRVKSPLGVSDLARTTDFLLWFAKSRSSMKFRQARTAKNLGDHPEFGLVMLPDGSTISRTEYEPDQHGKEARFFTAQNLASSGYTPSCMFEATVKGRSFAFPKGKSWKTNQVGMNRLNLANRLHPLDTSLRWRYFYDDAPSEAITDIWIDTFSASDKTYVVQTAESVIQRCVLMTSDPGDLVLDPTCGSGTTAYVAEQWARRWITIDTSRVALALARARIMGARYGYYLLSDSPEGQAKEAELQGRAPSIVGTHGNIRHGFVYERVPRVTLRSITNNAEIDVIWQSFEQVLGTLRTALNSELGTKWEEWQVPITADQKWSQSVKDIHATWREQISGRQKAIDTSIAAKADYDFLYDRPYEDRKKVRVAGPFTVESLSPHRVLVVGPDEELVEISSHGEDETRDAQNFVQVILDSLKISGVQQAHKEDKIVFASLAPWPGNYICAEGRYVEADRTERRAGIFIGPEFGTVTREDLVAAAREAGDAAFDVLIACAFSYDAHSADFNKLGRIRVLKARMNAELHMAEDLKNTGKGNLFVIFGEPDIQILDAPNGQILVKVYGVDVFHPSTGELRSNGPDEIACWFIDTDYNEESFFVRHAYFLGADDPYKALKTTLKAEIDEDAWDSLHSDTSRPFAKPQSGRIAVKVINHLGDEVMKVYRIDD